MSMPLRPVTEILLIRWDMLNKDEMRNVVQELDIGSIVAGLPFQISKSQDEIGMYFGGELSGGINMATRFRRISVQLSAGNPTVDMWVLTEKRETR